MAAADEIPSTETLKKAGEFEVYDQEGQKHKFSSLYAEKQTMVIFIRHFFCGNCMEYIHVLSSQIDPAEVGAKNMQIVFVGCGEWTVIKTYSADAGSKFPIYADPEANLYKTFGMVRSLAWGEKKPDWMSFGLVGGFFKGVRNGLKSGRNVFKGGDPKQNGGELLLGPGDKCEFAHIMQNTRDHTEIPEVRKAMGLEVSEKPANGTDGVVPPEVIVTPVSEQPAAA